MISVYPEETPFPVYQNSSWWSDNWDPLTFGRDFDFSRPFFEQFQELQHQVPRMALLQLQNENSEYTNCVSNLKDCYLLFSADFNHSCAYGVWIENCRDCFDNYILSDSELCYDSIFTQKSYRCVSSFHSSNCKNSAFIYDCKSCTDCFMCLGLRNKQYCINNKQYTKEQYETFIENTPLNEENYQKFKTLFRKEVKAFPKMYLYRNGRVENSTGNFLTDTQNCTSCFAVSNAKDCKYIEGAFDLKDSMDCCYANGELGYENCECVPMPFNSYFNVNCYTGSDLLYSDMCMNNCKNCFGSIGLKHKQYCILNKQYTKEQYEELLPKIIEHMKLSGEWGEFFPITLSPFAYNKTVAYDFYPLEKANEEIKSNNSASDLPESTLCCKKCSKNYKIIAEELRFYKSLQIPIPKLCFECRHASRLALTKKRELLQRACSKCQTSIATTHSPEDSDIVYCEKCYLEVIK